MSVILNKYGEWIYRIFVLVAIGAFWVGNSRASYATKEDITSAVSAVRNEVAAVSVQVNSLDKSLTVLAEQNKVNGRQDDQIRDFEMRLRELERHPK